MLIITFVDWN